MAGTGVFADFNEPVWEGELEWDISFCHVCDHSLWFPSPVTLWVNFSPSSNLNQCHAVRVKVFCTSSGRPRALPSISMCPVPRHVGTFLSWTWFQQNFLTCSPSFPCHHFYFLEKWKKKPPLSEWSLGIHLHPKLLPGPLVGGHSSVCKLGVLSELSWKKAFFFESRTEFLLCF